MADTETWLITRKNIKNRHHGGKEKIKLDLKKRIPV
jgi:hypothetical protein